MDFFSGEETETGNKDENQNESNFKLFAGFEGIDKSAIDC